MASQVLITILLHLQSAKCVISNATDPAEGYSHFSACLDRAEQPLEEGARSHRLLVVACMTQPGKGAPKASSGTGALLSAMFSGGSGDALAIDGIPKDGKERIRIRSEAKVPPSSCLIFKPCSPLGGRRTGRDVGSTTVQRSQ